MLIHRVHVNPKDALPLAFLRMHIKVEHVFSFLFFFSFSFLFFSRAEQQNVAHQNTGTNSNETQRQVQVIRTWVYSGLCRDAEDRPPRNKAYEHKEATRDKNQVQGRATQKKHMRHDHCLPLEQKTRTAVLKLLKIVCMRMKIHWRQSLRQNVRAEHQCYKQNAGLTCSTLSHAYAQDKHTAFDRQVIWYASLQLHAAPEWSAAPSDP